MSLLFATPAALGAAEKRLLLLLATAFFVGQYDMTILTLALPNVQDSFSISEESLGQLLGTARLGALPAILLALLADRVGRRRLLVVTLLGLSLSAVATGFAQTVTQFIAFQFCARLFTTTEEILAVIYALEMLPSRHRGWGVGFLAAMGALGSGLAALLYAGVDFLPGGWRALYVIGALPILYVAWLRRKLPESRMYEQQIRNNQQAPFWQPFAEIFLNHRRAILAVALISTTFWFQISASLNFISKYLQETHSYSPGQVSSLFIIAGLAAIFGNIVAGRVSDAIGRRPTLAAGIAVNCTAFLLFYNSSGFLLPLAWIAALFSFFVVDVVANATTGELFPTRCRSTASTLRTIFSVTAGVAGLTLEGSLYTQLGSHAAAISLLTLSSLLALPAVALLLRETANTDLS
ncbi:MAG: MFS transporter [Halieaceae bacterium]|jgi:MFS family permease|nr:MFS transporter [Halieaceae bacterium]